MRKEYTIAGKDFSAAGEAAMDIKKNLRRIGADRPIIRRTAIVAYECEMNIVIHALEGMLTFEIDPTRIILTALDTGPGIENIELAMQPGYSTAPEEIREMGFGAGMGLFNIKNSSDEFQLHSTVDKGTEVKTVIYLL